MSAVAEYFDKRAACWDDDAEPFGSKHIAVARIAGVREAVRVLDIGCGTGIMVPAYLVCGAAEVVGIDCSAEMVACAARKFAAEPRARFLHADATKLASGLESAEGAEDEEAACAPEGIVSNSLGSFDLAVIYNAYPHIRDKAALVKAVVSVLRPGGRFLVAHGAGRDMINAHHAKGVVPPDVSDGLRSAEEEARAWRASFEIDAMIDAPHLYCFGGVMRGEAC